MQVHKSEKTQYSRRFERLIHLAAVIVLVVSLTLTLSKTTHAGLVSFLSSIFGNERASARTTVSPGPLNNSQTMPLLEAPTNPDSDSVTRALAVLPIDSGGALSPDLASLNDISRIIEPLNTQISVYVVRPGDNLSTVAQMFNVSVNTILWANDLTSRSYLQPGQTLVILPVTGITYTIKAKDTIQGIAKKYSADVDEILSYNDMTLASTLNIGDEIIIPAAELPVTTQSIFVQTGSVPHEPLLDGWDWPSYPGYYTCPLPGSYISQKLHGHNGIDLAIARGTPIRAAARGTVIINRSNGAWNGGYGNFIAILHPNGTQTLYAHLSKSAVSAGVQVSQGQVIGYVGSTGLSTGPHLHLEVRGAKNPFSDPAVCR